MFTEAVINFAERQLPVEFKVDPLDHHLHGLSYTVTGYGNKIPSRYMVKYNGRWHRVYSCCFSNTSREYICSKGMQFTVDFY